MKGKMEEKVFGKKNKVHITTHENTEVHEVKEGHIEISNDEGYCIIEYD